MRRWFSVAFLSASIVVVPFAFAQHPGSGAGASHGGFSGGHGAGFAGGGHIGGGFAGGPFGRSSGFAPRSFAPPNFVSTAPSRAFAPGYRMPSSSSSSLWRGDGRGWDRGNHDRDRDGRYRSPYRGYGYAGYPYVYANSWELLPGDLGDSGFSGYGYDAASEPQQPAASAPVPDDGYRPAYDGPAYSSYASPEPPPNDQVSTTDTAEPALTLIFNDGHQETIHNYVLSSNAVVVLDDAASGRQKRIPLASIDLAATQQAAQQAGLDFTPPA